MKSLIPLLLIIGCTKGSIGCKVEETVVSAGSAAIASQLKCTGVEAIKTDLTKLVSKVGMCKKDSKIIGISACSILVSLVKDQIEVTPETWKCDSQATKDKIAEVLIKACETVL